MVAEGNKSSGNPPGRLMRSEGVDNRAAANRTATLKNQIVHKSPQIEPKKVNVMSETTVCCMVASREQAEHIVGQLKEANVSNNDPAAPFSPKGASRALAHETSTRAHEFEIARGLVGLGVSEVEAKLYEAEVNVGNVLLILVHNESSGEMTQDTLAARGAQDMSTTGTASTPENSPNTDRPAIPTMSAYSGHGR